MEYLKKTTNHPDQVGIKGGRLNMKEKKWLSRSLVRTKVNGN